MKRLKYLSALALSALLGLTSCSNDKLTGSTPSVAGSSKGYKVSFTLNNNMSKTRAAQPFNAGGFDREKAIDGTKLYAVVFDQQGKFTKTYDVEGYNASTGECHFTLDEAGVYYGYIVANTSKGTDLKGLTAGSSVEDDFYNIIEDTDPGTNNETSTNFLMTSKRTLFDVDGDSKDAAGADAEGTDLGDIELTRAVARIDIDATEIDGLEITDVEIQNRVVKSLMVRGSSPATLSSHQETTKTYTRGTNPGEIPALDGTTAGQEHAYVDNQQWQGVIYGYENIDANTVVKITHKLNGVASTTTVDFASVNGGQKIKRNNVYTVKLVNEVLTPTLTSIAATINVIDWDESVTLKYNNLTDNEKPDFKVTSGHVVVGGTDVANKVNPEKVYTVKDAVGEINLQVTSTGKVASEVAFVNRTGDGNYKFLDGSIGGEIAQVGSTSYVDGKIVQNYKITIPQSVLDGMTKNDYLTFKVHNVFDDTSLGSREFLVYKDYYNGIQVGDLIYQDGTWSTAADRTTTEFASKTPVAIVFATPNEITMPDYDINKGYIHGYAMALKENGQRYLWANPALTSFIGSGIEAVETLPLAHFNEIRRDYSGLEHCDQIQAAIDGGTYTLDRLPAYKRAKEYTAVAGETLANTTSGWFLPSIGQAYRWYVEFGGKVDNDAYSPVYRSSNNNNRICYYWAYGGSTYGTAINNYLAAKVGAGNYTPFVYGPQAEPGWYTTSTQYHHGNNVYNCMIFDLSWSNENAGGNNNGHLSSDYVTNKTYRVRPIIAL